MPTTSYPSDLTDQQWAILSPLIPPAKFGGRPRTANMRQVVNAIWSILRSGCQWRMLPREYPPWPTVWTYFRAWCDPRRLGADAYGTAGAQPKEPGARANSQCRHSGQPIGQDDGKRGPRGYDGGKKVKGRKRHLLVDTQGFIIKTVVYPADLTDREGGKLVLATLAPVQERFPRLRHLWVDSAYRGKFVAWVKEQFGWSVEVVQHWWTGVRYVWVAPGQEPPTLASLFHVLPHRWIVERTFAWLSTCRRLSKDYEYWPQSSEAWIYIAMIRLMVRRLAQEQT